MTSRSGPDNSSKGTRPRLGRIVWDDLRQGQFHQSLKRDFRDLYEFYLDEENRQELAGMGRFKRWLTLSWWILNAMVLKLAPARRIMLLVGLAVYILGSFQWQLESYKLQFSLNIRFIGFGLVLIVLMLELKDKLLARDELMVGRAVQLALMPEHNPELAGWEIWLYTRPANDVGGDLVDYLTVADDRLGLALGDVSGKGLGAALLMSKLQSTLRALAPDTDSLESLGQRVNRILCRDGLPGRFATLVYLELPRGGGPIRVLNAGHPPPYIVSGTTTRTQPPVAIPLGILPETPYQAQTIELQGDEWLLAYSDGVTEARNSQWELFGEERLEALLADSGTLSLSARGERIVAEVDRFLGEERPNDDLSLILVRRVSLPPPPPATG